MPSYNPLDADGDPFRPPTISTLVGCLHCQQEYDSYRIEWRVLTGSNGRPHGFWCCPIEDCDGRGFGCDIFPVDPDYRDEEGNKMWISDDEDDESEFDDEPDSGSSPKNDPDDPQDDDDEAVPF